LINKPTQTKANSLFQKGLLLLESAQLAKGRETLEKSLELFKKANDAEGEARNLMKIGRVIELMGEYPSAKGKYQEALGLSLALANRNAIAQSKANMGSVGWATGDYSEAGRFLAEALFLFRELGDIAGEAWAHDLVGNLKLAMRDDREAENSYLLSFTLVEGLGLNIENKAWNQYHLGALALFRQDHKQAKECFTEALGHFEKMEDVLARAATLVHLAEIAIEQKDYPTAETHLQKAVLLILPTQCRPLLMDALIGVAQLLKAQGDERKAIGILMVALSHPTCRQQTKDRMVALVITLESRFTPQEMSGGFRWAKDIGIDKMAEGWATSVKAKASAKKLA